MGFSFEKPITAQGNSFHSLSSPLQIYALFLVFQLLLLSHPTRVCHLFLSYPDVSCSQEALQITACRKCILSFYAGKLSLHQLVGVCFHFFIYQVSVSNLLISTILGSSDAQKCTQSSVSHGRRTNSRWNTKISPLHSCFPLSRNPKTYRCHRPPMDSAGCSEPSDHALVLLHSTSAKGQE